MVGVPIASLLGFQEVYTETPKRAELLYR